MALVGDRERERATASLRRHFVQGRLSVDELGDRVGLALAAQSTSDLRAAARGLPKPWQSPELIASAAGSVRRGARIAALLALASVWAVLSLSLAIALAVTMVAFGPSLAVAVAFGAIWTIVTFALWRPARRIY